MDGNNSQRAIPIKTGIKLAQQVNLKSPFDQFLLDDCRDLEIHICLCKRCLPIAIDTDRTRVIASMPCHNANS